MRSNVMKTRIARAKAANSAMTVVFYAVGCFFLLLLFVLIAYIISKGLIDFLSADSLLQQQRNRQSIFQYGVSCIPFAGDKRSAGCRRGYLFGGICKAGKTDSVHSGLYRISFLASLHRCGPVWISCVHSYDRRKVEPYGGCDGGFHTESSAGYHNDKGCLAFSAKRL